MGKQFEVEEILSCRILGGKEQYYLKWKGYPLSEATWEYKENLNCDFLLQQFKKSQEGKTPKKRKRPEVEVKTEAHQKAYRQSDPNLSDEDDVSNDGTQTKKVRKPGASGCESSHGPAAKKKKKRVTDVTGVSTPTTQKLQASSSSSQKKKQTASNRRIVSDSIYIRQTSSMVSSVQNSEDSQKIDESVQNTSAMSSSRVENAIQPVPEQIQKNSDESLIGESVQKAASVISNRVENDAQAVLEPVQQLGQDLENSNDEPVMKSLEKEVPFPVGSNDDIINDGVTIAKKSEESQKITIGESVQKASAGSSTLVENEVQPVSELIPKLAQDLRSPSDQLPVVKRSEKKIAFSDGSKDDIISDDVIIAKNSDESLIDESVQKASSISSTLVEPFQKAIQEVPTPTDEPPVEQRLVREKPVPVEGGGDDDNTVIIDKNYDKSLIGGSMQTASAISSSRVENGAQPVSDPINEKQQTSDFSAQLKTPTTLNRDKKSGKFIKQKGIPIPSVQNSDVTQKIAESVQTRPATSSSRGKNVVKHVSVPIQKKSDKTLAHKPMKKAATVSSSRIGGVVQSVLVPFQMAIQNFSDPNEQLLVEENTDEDVPPLSGIDIINFMIGQAQTSQNLATPMNEPPVEQNLEENPLPLENEAKMENENPVPVEGGGDDDDVLIIGERIGGTTYVDVVQGIPPKVDEVVISDEVPVEERNVAQISSNSFPFNVDSDDDEYPELATVDFTGCEIVHDLTINLKRYYYVQLKDNTEHIIKESIVRDRLPGEWLKYLLKKGEKQQEKLEEDNMRPTTSYADNPLRHLGHL